MEDLLEPASYSVAVKTEKGGGGGGDRHHDLNTIKTKKESKDDAQTIRKRKSMVPVVVAPPTLPFKQKTEILVNKQTHCPKKPNEVGKETLSIEQESNEQLVDQQLSCDTEAKSKLPEGEPGCEYMVLEEISSSDEGEDQEYTQNDLETMKRQDHGVSEVDGDQSQGPSTSKTCEISVPSKDKNREDAEYLVKCLKENPDHKTCRFCWRSDHIIAFCEDFKNKHLNKANNVWMEGCWQRRAICMKMSPRTNQSVTKHRRIKNQNRRINQKARAKARREMPREGKQMRLEEEEKQKRLEAEEKQKRLEDEEKQKRLDAAQVLLEIVHELLDDPAPPVHQSKKTQ